MKAQAEFFNREVILNSNTLEDSIDQYDSMVKEKCLADANRDDPRFFNVFPSSEMESWRRQWPVVPTFVYGGMNYGVLALSSFDAKASSATTRSSGSTRSSRTTTSRACRTR